MEYSYRPLIGLIEASATPVAEHEFHEFLPQGVWMTTCRVPFVEMSQSGLEGMMKNITYMTQMISSVPLDLIVILSMTGTCLRGNDLRNTLQQRTGVPTITAAQAVLEIVRKKHWKKLGIITNFNPELTFVERVFFNSNNIDVETISVREQEFITGNEVVDVSIMDKDKLLRVLQNADFSNVDALLFDGPFFDVNDIWGEIEERVKKPILTVNQSVLYTVLKIIGRPTAHLLVSKYLD